MNYFWRNQQYVSYRDGQTEVVTGLERTIHEHEATIRDLKERRVDTIIRQVTAQRMRANGGQLLFRTPSIAPAPGSGSIICLDPDP